MNKKLFLLFGMILSGFMLTGCNENYSKGLVFKLNENEDGYIVENLGKCKDSDIIIPSKYNGLPVTEIGENAFKLSNSVYSVTIPDSVTRVRSEAFYKCKNLEFNTYENCSYLGNERNPYLVLVKCDSDQNTVTISNKTKVIAGGAFQSSSITSLEIPSSVVTIDDLAFYGSDITSFKIPSNVTTLGRSVFNRCNKLKAVTFENKSKLKIISVSAFEQCTSLSSISLPSGVENIEESAFESCTYLLFVEIPNTIASIEESAFLGCDSLVYNEYENCSYLGNKNNKYVALMKLNDKTKTKVEINNNTRVIGGSAFSKSQISSINIPDSVVAIERNAFNDSFLNTIEIPNSVTKIGYSAFSRCSDLKSVTFEKGSKLEEIEMLAFYKCTSLTSIILPSNLKSISKAMFSECESLTSITIPSSVTIIDDEAFIYCKSLVNIEIPNNITYIGSKAFGGCSSLNFNEYENCFYFGNKYNPYLVLIRIKDSSLKEVKISNKTKIIYSAAFENSSISSIQIPHSVIQISAYAFIGSKLSSIVIPNSILNISENAFCRCSDLSKVTFEKSSKLKEIGGGAFSFCYSLKEIVIPLSVKKLGSDMFYDCEGLSVYCEAESRPGEWAIDESNLNVRFYWKNEWSYVNGKPTVKEK